MLIDVGAIMARATLARHKAGYLNAPPPYRTHEIVAAAFPDVIVTGGDLPAGITEMVETRAGGGKVIWYNRKVNHGAQRVGIAHGIHHLLTDLRTRTGIRECNLDTRSLERERPDLMRPDAIEVACDLFAGELLVPFNILDELAPDALFPRAPGKQDAWRDDVDSLSALFNVPAGFMRWRLYDLIHLRKTHFAI